MHHLLNLLFILLASSHIAMANSANMAELDADLALLIPGESIQESSARAYAKTKLQDFITNLEARKIRRKSTTKAVEMLREATTSVFLKESRGIAPFEELFKSGAFDQSTASVLYALLLNYLDIPFAASVHNADLYLLVDPSREKMPINIPSFGFTNQSDRAFQQTYLALIKDVGYLPQSVWHEAPAMLFNQYYFDAQRPLSLPEMAGFLYYRQALVAYKNKNFHAALDRIHLANQHGARPPYEVLRRVVWLQLANDDASSSSALTYLWKLWEEQPLPELEAEMLTRFHAGAGACIQRSHSALDSLYGQYAALCRSSAPLSRQLRQLYWVESARSYAKNGKTTELMTCMDSLYLLQPDDKNLQQMMAGMLTWAQHDQRDFQEGLLNAAAYERRYPFLKDALLFQDQHLFYEAERIRALFDGDNALSAEYYVQLFENHLSQLGGSTPRHVYWVSTVYLSGSWYYFRQGDYARARSYIERALLRAPNDVYLQHRLEVLRRH